VLSLLLDLKTDIQSLKRGRMSGAETQSGEDLGTFQATSLDDFHESENKLKDSEERRKMVRIVGC